MNPARLKRWLILRDKQPELARLIKTYGGYEEIHWENVQLIEAQTSTVWVVQRPEDGKLTLLCAAHPFPKPENYLQAWPAKFESELLDDNERADLFLQGVLQR